MDVLYDGFADSKYRPCPLLKQYVAAGWLGRKSGRGFYTYADDRPTRSRSSSSPTSSARSPRSPRKSRSAKSRRISRRWDREHTFPRELYTKLNDAGIMGIIVPEAVRRRRRGLRFVCARDRRACAHRCGHGRNGFRALDDLLGDHASSAASDQKKHWLPRLASGDEIAAFALDRTRCGSDAAGVTFDREDAVDGGYVLNGRKQWCTNGSYAGVTMGMFRTGGSGRARASARFSIDQAIAGHHGRESHREARHSHEQHRRSRVRRRARSATTRCSAPKATASASAMTALAGGRIGIAAQATGILAGCFDQSVAFAKDRIAFGQPIGAFEGVSFKIAQMATDLDAARLLVYRAAALADAGKPFVIEASKAKLFASTAARKHAAEALQIHGGYGYTTEFPDRAVLSRREDHGNLRRHFGDPADHYRAIAVGQN